MHVLTVYVKDKPPFALTLPLKALRILTYDFDWRYPIQYLISLFLSITILLFTTVCDTVFSSTTDKVLSINGSAVLK